MSPKSRLDTSESKTGHTICNLVSQSWIPTLNMVFQTLSAFFVQFIHKYNRNHLWRFKKLKNFFIFAKIFNIEYLDANIMANGTIQGV